jgi:hypothetical protein
VFGLKVPSLAALLLCMPGFASAPYLYTQAARYDSKGGERFPAGARIMLLAAAPRALVSGFAASADPAVSFDGGRVLFAGKQKPGESWQVYEVPAAGGVPHRITSGGEDCVRPFYLPDDKLVYSRRTPHGYQLEIAPLAGGPPLRLTYSAGDHFATDVLRDGRVLFEAPHAASAGRDLYTVYVDGSGVETVRCDHGLDRSAGRQLASGDIVFVTSTGLARFTSARAVALPLAAPKGQYAGPAAELDSGELLISWRPDAKTPYALYGLKPGRPQMEKVMANALQPVLVRQHPVPLRHPSGLGDRNGANLLCLNAYTSRDGNLPAGLIHAVRVFAQDDAGNTVKLGEAPVEKDGSFFLTVPSERPLRFELMDKAARVVKSQKGWFWTRRGEQRVCVGCHAGPERAPDNAQPAVLERTTDPVKFAMPDGGLK